ncbi:MFS transporter, siderochrome-iron transporter [Rhodotorula toruloides]|uniref:MFS transporter, siderochrome-iron transporter n=1 Tax=Rhodotorula toruloides TaxID=5286 RepID=A0A511KGT2_RHOTO|nr:MFS transporter, siderochrome-iron transporter [Rhodotorula toruloides]
MLPDYDRKDTMDDEKGAETRIEDSTTATVEPVYKVSPRAIGCVVGAAFALFAATFGVTSTGVYAASIGVGAGDASATPWFSNTAQICQAILGPLFSLSADLWGRKPFMVVGLAIGAVGGIVTSTSHLHQVALLGAVFTGIGFATQGLYVAVCSEVMPRSQRPKVQAILNVIGSSGGAFGIAAGGLYVKYNVVGAGWRMIYATLAIVYGLACMTILFCYRPLQRRPDVSAVFHQRNPILVLDLVGVALLLCGIPPLYYGFVSALNPYKWSDAHVLVPLLTGVAGLVAFGFWEWKGNKEGLLHHALFSKSRNYGLSLALLFLEGILFFSFNAFWAREATLILGLPAWLAGLNFLWFYIISVLATPIFGWASQRFKEVRGGLTIGFGLFLTASIGMATVNPDSRIAFRVYAALGGIAFASPLTLMSVTAQLAAPPQLLALASINLLVSRALGGVVAVACYNAVTKTRLAANLDPRLTAAVTPLGFPASEMPGLIHAAQLSGPQSVAALKQLNGMTPSIIEAVQAAMPHIYADSYRWVWVIAAPVALIAIVLIWLLEPIAPMMTARIDAPADIKAEARTELERDVETL